MSPTLTKYFEYQANQRKVRDEKAKEFWTHERARKGYDPIYKGKLHPEELNELRRAHLAE